MTISRGSGLRFRITTCGAVGLLGSLGARAGCCLLSIAVSCLSITRILSDTCLRPASCIWCSGAATCGASSGGHIVYSEVCGNEEREKSRMREMKNMRGKGCEV